MRPHTPDLSLVMFSWTLERKNSPRSALMPPRVTHSVLLPNPESRDPDRYFEGVFALVPRRRRSSFLVGPPRAQNRLSHKRRGRHVSRREC